MQVPGKYEVDDTPQLELPPIYLSSQTAAKDAAEQSGSIARAQAIADRLAALADSLPDGTSAGSPETVDGVSGQTRANGIAAEHAPLPASGAAAIPGISTVNQQAHQQFASVPDLAVADITKRRRPSKFDQPATEAHLPPPPQLAQPLPGPPPQPPPQPQSGSDRESQESMRDRALAIAARFAANAPQSISMQNNESSQGAAGKQPGAAGASAESEFEDDSDPFKGLPAMPPAPAPPRPQVFRSLPAQPPAASHTAPQQPEHHSSQAKQPPPPHREFSRTWAWDRDLLAVEQKAPQPPRGPPPGQPQVAPPRPPPPGPRPPPGAPGAHPPPQHHPHYPSHLHVRQRCWFSSCHALRHCCLMLTHCNVCMNQLSHPHVLFCKTHSLRCLSWGMQCRLTHSHTKGSTALQT